jgi:hypothetical protein
MAVLETLAAIASFADSASKLKGAFGDKGGGGVGGTASAETQSGQGLEYAPVGLESLEITPFEYALLDEMYKQQQEEQQQEEPEEMMYGGPVYAEEGGGLETLFEDDLFEDVVFEDVDASMEIPEPVFEEDEYTKDRKKREERLQKTMDTFNELNKYMNMLTNFKSDIDVLTGSNNKGSSIKSRGSVVPKAGRIQQTRVGGTTINPFEYRQYKNGGEIDAVLDRRMFAANPMFHGGDVRGPGGPKDDLIPVMASNGEFMLSKAAVDQVGGGNHSKGIAMLEEFNELGNQRYG